LRNHSSSGRPRLWPRVVFASLAVAIYVVPVYLALINVFKTKDQIGSAPAALPSPWTLSNIVSVFSQQDGDLVTTLLRSVFLTASTIIGVSIIGSSLGYYLARYETRASRVLFIVLVMGLAIPFQVILIPVTQVLRKIGILGSYPGLLLFNIGYYVPFAALLFSRFTKSIPRELDEAAMLDGAGPIRIYFRVILPLMQPASASVAIFLAVWVWNDFVNPLILLGPKTGNTIMTGLYRTMGQYQVEFGPIFTFMFFATLPLLVLFLLLQDRFIQGLTSGATKG
jgi:raffinose/stachyose/melibiose transport system permease protein